MEIEGKGWEMMGEFVGGEVKGMGGEVEKVMVRVGEGGGGMRGEEIEGKMGMRKD